MIDWILDHLYWIILTPFIIRFIIKDIPNYLYKRKRGYYEQEENDNITKEPHDYM